MTHNDTRWLAAMAALALVLGCGAAARAEDRPLATLGRLDASLDIALKGRIVERCSLGTVGGSIDFGRLTQQRSAQAQLNLDCNVPFALTLTATRGGLAHQTLPGGQGPFAGTLGYSVALQMPLKNAAGTRVIQRDFAGRDLVGGAMVSSDFDISNGPVGIGFVTLPPPSDGLLAGDYSDTVTVTINPQI